MRNLKRILAILTSLALIISALSFSLLTVSGEESQSTNFYAALDFESTTEADLVVRNEENPAALLMQPLRENSQLQLRSGETGNSLVHSVYAWADLFFHFEERSDAKLASAFAFYLDMTDAHYPATLNDIYLYEKNGEVYRGYASGSVLLVDEAGCVELQFDSADDKQVIPANFKGWVVLSKEFFKTHESFVERTKNGILELDKVNSLGIDITYGSNSSNPENIAFDNFGYIVNIDEFIESVGSDKDNKNIVYSDLLADSVITNIENYNGYSTTTLDGENAVYFEGNANGQYAIEFDVAFPNKADVLASMDYVDALALRVKFTGDSRIDQFHVWENIGGNKTEQRSATTVYAYDNNTATKYVFGGGNPTPVFSGFDGWLIVPFNAFGATVQSIVDNDAFDPVNLCHVYIDDWYANADKTVTMSKFALVNLEDFVGYKDVAFDSTYSDLNEVSDIPSGLIGDDGSGSNAPDKEIVELDGKNALKLSCSAGWSYFTLAQNIPNKVADPKYIAFRVDYNFTDVWNMFLSESYDTTSPLYQTEQHKISQATLVNAADMSTEEVTELPNAFNGWIVVDMESGLPYATGNATVGSSDQSVFDYQYFNRLYVKSDNKFDHFTYGGVAIAKDYNSMVAFINNASKKPDVYFDEPYTGLDTISNAATMLNTDANSAFGYVIADDYLDGKNALKVTDTNWGQYAVDATFPTDKVSSVGAVAIRVKYEGLWPGADGICFSEYGKKLETVNEANASELSNIASATLIYAEDLRVESVSGLPASFDGWIVIDTNNGFVSRNSKPYGNVGFEAENVVGIYVGANQNTFAISTTAVATDCDAMIENIKALYKTNDKVAVSDLYTGLDTISNAATMLNTDANSAFGYVIADDYLDGKNALKVTDTNWGQYVVDATFPTDKVSSVGAVAIRVKYEGLWPGADGICFSEFGKKIETALEVNSSELSNIASATLIYAEDLRVESVSGLPASFDGWIVIDTNNGFVSRNSKPYGNVGFEAENVVGIYVGANQNTFAISTTAVATDCDAMLKYILGDTEESEEAPAYKEFSGHSDMKYPVWIEVNGEKLASADWTVASNGTVKVLEGVCADGAVVKYRDPINEYTWNAGSWSQLYASDLLFGDVTGEGEVDILDLVASKNAVEGNITVAVPTAMDVSFDFATDEQDVMSIRKLLIGQSVYYGNTDTYKTLSDIIAE